jgi:hypothetical protein
LGEGNVSLGSELRSAKADVTAEPAGTVVDGVGQERRGDVPVLADENPGAIILGLPVRVTKQDAGAVLGDEVSLEIDFDPSASFRGAEKSISIRPPVSAVPNFRPLTSSPSRVLLASISKSGSPWSCSEKTNRVKAPGEVRWLE